ncbi:MAG: hypothetical protein D6737_14820 [Chloroflexi bacterium]|nr:MAG: hypothetical protein CUN54_02535 [Phototrophicales bacterium]RMF78412.1 MAG: hypothetical protein D6737_14820 [Chloroflexota bacterium]
MAANSVFRWLDGRGWLILAGGVDDTAEIRGAALTRIAADGAVACVALANDLTGERTLDDLESLGAPAGYIVDILSEDDATIVQKLSDASMIVIADMSNPFTLRSALLGAALEGMQNAFERGAVILAEGIASMLFGTWVALDETVLDGFEWLQSAAIMARTQAVGDLTQIRDLLIEQPAAIAVGVGGGSALALGPDGQLETWGQREITITLGSFYSG